MPISNEMVAWLKKNLNPEGTTLTKMEEITGLNYKQRFTDFDDDSLNNFLSSTDERRFPWIRDMLIQRAIEAGMSEMEHHLCGFRSEEEYQGWYKSLCELIRSHV